MSWLICVHWVNTALILSLRLDESFPISNIKMENLFSKRTECPGLVSKDSNWSRPWEMIEAGCGLDRGFIEVETEKCLHVEIILPWQNHSTKKAAQLSRNSLPPFAKIKASSKTIRFQSCLPSHDQRSGRKKESRKDGQFRAGGQWLDSRSPQWQRFDQITDHRHEP